MEILKERGLKKQILAEQNFHAFVLLLFKMDYGIPERRKTKKDLKRKRKFRAYKRGGKFRSLEVKEVDEKKGKKRR